MLTHVRRIVDLVTILLASFVTAWATTEVSIFTDATFVDTGLVATRTQTFPTYPMTNDRSIKLGGIGSDLYHMPGHAANVFWAVTDRDPNGKVEIASETRPTSFAPAYTHDIEYMPITTATGKPVTELPNIAVYDVQFWDATGTTKLDYNPNGLDTEGLVRTSNREFWVADEYSPSLAHGFEGLSITKDGKTIFFVLQKPTHRTRQKIW